jgi:hypothetical protein
MASGDVILGFANEYMLFNILVVKEFGIPCSEQH